MLLVHCEAQTYNNLIDFVVQKLLMCPPPFESDIAELLNEIRPLEHSGRPFGRSLHFDCTFSNICPVHVVLHSPFAFELIICN